MAILLPALSKAREQARRAICGHNLKEIGLAIIAYAGDTDLLPSYGGRDPSYNTNGTKTHQSDTPSDSQETHPYVAFRDDDRAPDSTGNLVPMRLGCLWARHYIEDPKVFYCPSSTLDSKKFKSYNNPAPWSTLPQVFNATTDNEWVRVGYDYYPIDEFLKTSDNSYGIPVPLYTARRFSSLSKKNPFASDGLWSLPTINHKSGYNSGNNTVVNAGINVVFKDGHVKFARDDSVHYYEGRIRRETKLFGNDNPFWENWDPTERPDGMDFRYLYYPIFSSIKP
jgi:hypothetical protein